MTVASETAIYNLALNAIGARNNVSSPSEDSREAEVCRLWYPAVRDQVLAAAFWPEATKFDYLALLNEQDDSVWTSGEAFPGFVYSYQQPTDLLRPQYLSTFEPFRVTNQTINTNTAQALLAYTFRNELVTTWSAGLQMAIVHGLAANICMPLTAKAQRTNLMLGQANNAILAAREASANWSVEAHETLPEWIQARGFGMSSHSRFIYPFGGLLSVPGA